MSLKKSCKTPNCLKTTSGRHNFCNSCQEKSKKDNIEEKFKKLEKEHKEMIKLYEDMKEQEKYLMESLKICYK